MYIILVRVVIIFVIVLSLIRLMGKRQIGELQPFELVITLIVADVATLPMSEPSIPLINGIIPLIALVILQFFLSYLSRKSLKMRKIINGKPVIVVDGDGIVYENLKSLNMSINDLQEALRGCQVTNFDIVQYALIETNGKASVILKSSQEPVTRQDMKIENKENSLPIVIVCEGKINQENIIITKMSEKDIIKLAYSVNINKIEEILIMNIDNNGKVYIQPIKGKCQTIYFDTFKGGSNW